MPPGDSLIEEARKAVKKRWVKQGIWSSNWNQFARGPWKHEESLELESESERESEAGPASSPFCLFPKPQLKPRRPKSDNEKRRIVERRDKWEREREASRPIIISSIRYRRSPKEHKKNPRMGKMLMLPTSIRERTRMSRTLGPSEGCAKGRWSILPGMSWKHEEPLFRRSQKQRALYTRAKRRGGALPDRAGLNPRRQRIGTDSTYKVCAKIM